MAIHGKLHAAEHIDGTDDIQSATNAQKGLATAAQITALEDTPSIDGTPVDLKPALFGGADSIQDITNTLYVDPADGDAKAKIEAASANDKIVLLNGTHTVTSTVTVPANVVVEGETKLGAIMKASNAVTGKIIDASADDVTLRGFSLRQDPIDDMIGIEIDGTGGGVYDMDIETSYHGIEIDRSNVQTVIKGNRITTGGSGIFVDAYGTHLQISDNFLIDCALTMIDYDSTNATRDSYVINNTIVSNYYPSTEIMMLRVLTVASNAAFTDFDTVTQAVSGATGKIARTSGTTQIYVWLTGATDFDTTNTVTGALGGSQIPSIVYNGGATGISIQGSVTGVSGGRVNGRVLVQGNIIEVFGRCLELPGSRIEAANNMMSTTKGIGIFNTGKFNTIVDNYVQTTPSDSAVQLSNASSNCLLDGNYFLVEGAPTTGALRIDGDMHTVRNNRMSALSKFRFTLDSGTVPSSGEIIAFESGGHGETNTTELITGSSYYLWMNEVDGAINNGDIVRSNDGSFAGTLTAITDVTTGIELSGRNHTVEGNSIGYSHGPSAFGVDVNEGSHTIRNNTIRSQEQGGVRVSAGEHSIVEGNIIKDCGDAGIDSTGTSEHIRIINNRLFDGGWSASNDAIDVSGATDVKVRGNSIDTTIVDVTVASGVGYLVAEFVDQATSLARGVVMAINGNVLTIKNVGDVEFDASNNVVGEASSTSSAASAVAKVATYVDGISIGTTAYACVEDNDVTAVTNDGITLVTVPRFKLNDNAVNLCGRDGLRLDVQEGIIDGHQVSECTGLALNLLSNCDQIDIGENFLDGGVTFDNGVTNIKIANASCTGTFTQGTSTSLRFNGNTGMPSRSSNTYTDNHTVLVAEAEMTLLMDAGAEKTFSLPSVDATNVGLRYTFGVMDGFKLNIDPADADTIDDSTATTGDISTTGQYNTITLELASVTEWIISGGANGTWTTT